MDLHITGVEPELPPQPDRWRGRQHRRRGAQLVTTRSPDSTGPGFLACLLAPLHTWAMSRIDRRVQRFYDRDCD